MTPELKDELIALQYLKDNPDVTMAVLYSAYEGLFGKNADIILTSFKKKEYIRHEPVFHPYGKPRVVFDSSIINDANDKCNISKIGERYYKHLKDQEKYYYSDLGGKVFYYKKRWVPFILSGFAAIIALASLCVSIRTCNLREQSQIQQEIKLEKSKIPLKTKKTL